MQLTHWKNIKEAIKKYILNKYVLTLLIFIVIFLFVGEQSLIKGIQRNQKIRKYEHAIQVSDDAIQCANNQLHSLEQVDSLEKYGREHYLMHKENEDIYLIEE